MEEIDTWPFVGRGDILERMKEVLLTPNLSRTIALTGMGGIGKTALAMHFASMYQYAFPDGVFALRVDGSQDILEVARRFADLSGWVPPDWARDLPALGATGVIQTVFSRKRALLIIDRVEDGRARALYPSGYDCAVIVTTQYGQLYHHHLPPEQVIPLTAFTLEESAALLLRSGVLDDPALRGRMEAVRDLVDVTGGLPLALRIAAGTMKQQGIPLGEYIATLHGEEGCLARLRDPQDPELDMRATFERSLRILGDEVTELFACLGTLDPDGMTREAVQRARPLDERFYLDGQLGRLLSHALLEWDKQACRFVLHPLLRQFSRALARERGLL